MRVKEATLARIVDDLEVLQSELGVTLQALMARRGGDSDEDLNEVDLTDTDLFLIRRYADVDIADPLPPVGFTRTGFEWSELVNELEWDERDTAYAAIESQLPEGYGDSADKFTIYLNDDHAHLTRAAWEQLLAVGIEQPCSILD